jgi:nucleoid DNA-binding protein
MHRDRGAADPATKLRAGAVANLNRAMRNTSTGNAKIRNWLKIHGSCRRDAFVCGLARRATISVEVSGDGLLVRVGVPPQGWRPWHALGVPKADVSPYGGAKKTRRRRPDRVRAQACPAADATGAQKPLEKSRFGLPARKKNSCAGVSMCYFPRRFVIARLHNSAHVHSFEEWRNMAKKGSAPTKSEVLTQISKDTGLSRKQVGSVFDSLNGVIKKSLRSNGLFTMPGLLKMKVVKKPATKAREGINPFTGEKMMFKAKPASKKVRVMPLKNLKAMVNS